MFFAAFFCAIYPAQVDFQINANLLQKHENRTKK